MLFQVGMSIGPKVRQLRRQKNLSLQQLAERAGLSAAAIHKMLHDNYEAEPAFSDPIAGSYYELRRRTG